MSAIIFQTQSTLILGLMYFGVLKRKNRKLHVKIMGTAILWDILLILQIELTRNAIDKAMRPSVNNSILNIHIALALSSVIFYFIMIYTGRKLLKGDTSIRAKHKVCGRLTILLRTLTFITSFFTVN